MSVLVRKRTLSRLEFYNTAVELRKKITLEVLPTFCVRQKNLGRVEIWLLLRLRGSTYDILHDLMLNITRAYTIWATNTAEAMERRNAQNRAIADCESLLKELEYACSVLPVDAERYMVYVDMIEKEIALLKGWRKSDNARHKHLRA